MSTLQTARVMPKGEMEFIAGAGLYESPSATETVENEPVDQFKDLSFPFFEMGVRTGMEKYLELSGKITMVGAMSGQVKYQFIDTYYFAMAAAFGLGYQYIPLTEVQNPSSIKSGLHVLETTLPFFLSFDITKSIVPYLSVRYLLRHHFGVRHGRSHLVGFAGGIKFGKTYGAYLEVSRLHALDTPFRGVQYNAAFFYELGDSLQPL